MFDKFCDYMYYLLTSPFKKVKKSLNQWYILFNVLGKRFDDAMECLYKAREQTMIATCDPVMLLVHASDRNMIRYAGEDNENFRKRIANYTEVCRLGGTNEGVILAVWSLGFNNVSIVPAKSFTGDSTRWAEFYVILVIEADETYIGFDVLKKEVRKTKEVGAKDNYYFIYKLDLILSNEVSTKLSKVKFHFVIYYFDYIRLDGKYIMDGSTFLNNKIKNDAVSYKTRFILKHSYSINVKIDLEVA